MGFCILKSTASSYKSLALWMYLNLIKNLM